MNKTISAVSLAFAAFTFLSTVPGLSVVISAGQTMYLRLYPYNTGEGSGKSIMVANLAIAGVIG